MKRRGFLKGLAAVFVATPAIRALSEKVREELPERLPDKPPRVIRFRDQHDRPTTLTMTL